MPDSSALSEETLGFFEQRFGVARIALADLALIDRHDEIWACSSAPPIGLEPNRPPGLRALRRRPDGLKPTSAFLAAIGTLITASRIDLDTDALRQVLLGRRIPVSADPGDGYVALCLRGDVLGCGRFRGGFVHALLPTGRRRELLAALDADPRD